ncbi:MAG: NAD+ synthase [Nitrosomonadaceae bacterium]|nr:NAD+ synthase [Nitrosomonadaceae bacterium]|tara:strand:+ start:471 stop:2087 length:1617 start_codon:yes stop_codon:yes gene_type:complete
MRIAIAQINCTVGDLTGNAKKILDFTNQAKNKDTALVITPELALSGYPPEDLLLLDGFRLACIKAFDNLVKEINGISLLLGHPYFINNRIYNAASLICDGKVVATYFKNNLLNDNWFTESYYFEAGLDSCVFTSEGIKFGINISTDILQEINTVAVKREGAEALILLCASPYHVNKQAILHNLICQRAHKIGIPIICVNLVGGQDELVFDGASFVVNFKGDLIHQFDGFIETLGLIEFQGGLPMKGLVTNTDIQEENIYRALCLGVKDYINKNDFTNVILGISGGIDSALTLAIAVDALGSDRVWAVMMPSEYTASISLQDSRAISKALGVNYSEFSINTMFDQLLNSLVNKFQWPQDQHEIGVTEENIQARIRGTILMALSNKYGAIVLTTSNKSEMVTGYSTLYGDMAGGLAVLKDVSKSMVYKLCNYRNSLSMVIPERIIQRAPSAELRPNQIDQDNLPPYNIIDGIIEEYIENGKSLYEIVDMGYPKADVRHIVSLLCKNEYKRRQSPLGICITKQSFSKGWRYPITSKYKDTV